MHLIDVDDIGFEPPQRMFDLLEDKKHERGAERLVILPIEPGFGCYQDFASSARPVPVPGPRSPRNRRIRKTGAEIA